MAPRRRKQRRRENRRVPPPAVAPVPPSNSPQITRLEKCKRIFEAVKETIVERILDLTILLGKFCRGLRRGISLLDLVSYGVLIGASQLWLSISIVENLVYLFILSGINFQFPFPNLAKLIVESKVYLAGDYRLLVLSCVCIAFVNDVLMSNRQLSPVKRLKIYWNLFFTLVTMYAFIPFMNNFTLIMNVVLVIFSCARIAVEVATHCTTRDMLASLNFLPPRFLMFHFLFISILGIGLAYYEADKFLDNYTRVTPPKK